MRLKIVRSVLLCLVLGCSAIAKTTEGIATVETIDDLEVLFVEQQYQFLAVSPPSEDVYIHSYQIVLPVDWKKFPSEFTSLMYAQMDENGYPLYRVTVYEDPVTRDTVFLNSYGTEAYRLSPEGGYDPFLWAKTTFDISSELELDEWHRWIFDPAHIALNCTLIPEAFHENYLDSQLSASTEPIVMMMSLPAVVTNLIMAINNTTNGAVEVEIGWPASFTNDLEIFVTADLPGHVWQIIPTNITTSSTTNFLWTDWDSTNTPNRFYMASNADLDTDTDGLADGREIYVYGSQPDDQDSDNDGLDDDVEVGASPPTDPSNDDTNAPAITIASPVNNIVVMP